MVRNCFVTELVWRWMRKIKTRQIRMVRMVMLK